MPRRAGMAQKPRQRLPKPTERYFCRAPCWVRPSLHPPLTSAAPWVALCVRRSTCDASTSRCVAQAPTPVTVNPSGLQQPARPGRGVPSAGSGCARVGRRGKMWPSAQGADTARARSRQACPASAGLQHRPASAAKAVLVRACETLVRKRHPRQVTSAVGGHF
jgi:hypothetical protein